MHDLIVFQSFTCPFAIYNLSQISKVFCCDMFSSAFYEENDDAISSMGECNTIGSAYSHLQ